MPELPLTLRRYQPSDLPAIVDICVRTGDNGADASGGYADNSLLAAVYARPYVLLEPDLAFVVDDGTRAVGYILGTADTLRFIERYRSEYLPQIVAEYRTLEVGDHAPSAGLIREGLRRPERLWRAQFKGYPAHLHIDLLPVAQARGNGRRLMERFLDTLRARNVPGVHLGVSAANEQALGFYQRLNFELLPIEVPGSLYLGLRLS